MKTSLYSERLEAFGVNRPHRIILFWIPATLAITATNIIVAGSLLNLYKISGNARPIFFMMIVEALVPLCTIPFVVRLLKSRPTDFLFSLICLLGALGACILSMNVTSLMIQLIGITITTLSSAFQKPLLMELAPRMSTDKSEREAINKKVTLITYAGLLLGYISSGILITYLGYRTCFLFSAALFAIFWITLAGFQLPELKKRPSAKDNDVRQNTSTPPSSNNHRGLTLIFMLAIAQWITGGSINVLEVPFAQKAMGASELMVTILFFFSALGAIVYSVSAQKKRYVVSGRRLIMSTLTGGVMILAYVKIAKYAWVLPFLFGYGFSMAYQSFLAMSLIQEFSSPKDLSKFSVGLNTVIQVMTLLAAGGGVFATQWLSEQTVCGTFSEVTIAMAVTALLLFKIYGESCQPSINVVSPISADLAKGGATFQRSEVSK